MRNSRLRRTHIEKGILATMSNESGNAILPTQGDHESQGVSAITQIAKGCGPSKGVQVKKPMHLEFNVLNVPDGEWSKEYRKQVGSCAQRININEKEYRKIDEQTRQGFWEETKLMFHIIEDVDKSREKYFHSCVAKRFRDFKTKLVRRWITKKQKPSKYPTNKMPWEIYHHITEADWSVLLREYYMPESLARSEKARASAVLNKSPRLTGQAGYIRKRHEWIKEGRLPSEAALSLSSSSSVNSSVPRARKYRSKEWVLAHQVRSKDEKWEVNPNDKEAVEIARKVEEYIEEEEKENLTFEDDEDALTKAIGKKDHRGRVKAMGGNVGYRVAFGPRERRRRCSSEASSDLIESIKSEIRKEFEGELEKRVAEALQKQLRSMLHINHPNSTSNPVLELNELNVSYTTRPDSTPQPRELKERTPCHLALEDKYSGNKVLVADGMVQPSNGASSRHFTPMKHDHYKVQVDFVYEVHNDDILPVPTGDGFTNLGGAQGSFVQWPIRLVIFKDDEDYTPRPTKKSKSFLSKKVDDSAKNTKSNKEAVGSCDRKTEESAAKRKKAENEEIQGHGQSCKYLHFIMSSASGGIYDSTPIPLDASVWNFVRDQETYVTASDVEEFLKGACLNISVIQVYMMYLLDNHTYAFENSRIGFICPEMVSSTRIRADPTVPADYLQRVFNAETAKNTIKDSNSAKLFLIPYNQDNHWILYVIDLFRAQVYLFDSLKGQGNRTTDASGIMNLAFQVYKYQGGKCEKLIGKRKMLRVCNIECAQQSGRTECGYYVMKFMLDIVTGLYDSNDRLDKLYPKRKTSYTCEEMDVVREQWAQYFTSKYLLSD